MSWAVGRSLIVPIAVAAALALAGCISTGSPTPSPSDAEGTAISFESIDGAPRQVSTRLTRTLDQEATARRLTVVSSGGQALYHVRGYLAAHSEAGGTSIDWAFDVYDTQRKRAFRLRGEERAAGQGTWAAADDAVLQRIAANSINQLMTLIAADRATQAGIPAAGGPSIFAGVIDDFGPESAGIVRILARNPPPSADDNRAVPLPPLRPNQDAPLGSASLAYSAAD